MPMQIPVLSPHSTGTVMRSKAWDTLEKDGCIAIQGPLSKQKHLKRNQLIVNCKKIDIASWKEEIDMYNDVIEAFKKGSIILNKKEEKMKSSLLILI